MQPTNDSLLFNLPLCHNENILDGQIKQVSIGQGG